ncbi:TRAP transporter small permease [Marinobacterium lutimaris]|uniref:TRAP transporter small permease protein n=1 Tax=Marinobacterium lutimaris TaxID=568106 RepID=A0A1H6DAE6_9GAMM|nr:TRAP transporter small permease subunit [Marinobacterium lutimaris]SEG82162.1 TRAP-type C4-dicarboxylate transport system, small permease component [Marinobacterium lutimaris]
MMLARFYIGLVKRLNQGAGILCGTLIVYMAAHILLEIVLRLFNTSTYVLNEFIGYAVATMTFMGLGFALERGGLIRVGLVINRLSPNAAMWLDLAISSAMLALFGWLSWYWGINVNRSYSRGITSESLADTPLWIPEGAVLLGLVLLCLTLSSRVLSLLVFRKTPIDLEPR